ncbi:MAG: serine/threonine-protein phosphatase [Oscillospiraceae bacterium]|nr:serine/threonine-protein phosphatase [Oscillospiraceae bacterium]
MDAYLYTNEGGKSHNEDNADYSVDVDHSFFVLADGLGGLKKGEVASQHVVNSLIDYWNRDGLPDDGRAEWLRSRILAANESLVELQKTQNAKMKSTVVALALDENKAVWGHAGDSRLYYISDGRVRYVTRDHSVAYKKYQAGEISFDGISVDEDQSSLLMSVGDAERCTPEIIESRTEVKQGDSFLLCSDGAWTYLRSDEILVDSLKSSTAKEWVELLLTRIIARIRKGSDNLTLLAVKL